MESGVIQCIFHIDASKRAAMAFGSRIRFFPIRTVYKFPFGKNCFTIGENIVRNAVGSAKANFFTIENDVLICPVQKLLVPKTHLCPKSIPYSETHIYLLSPPPTYSFILILISHPLQLPIPLALKTHHWQKHEKSPTLVFPGDERIHLHFPEFDFQLLQVPTLVHMSIILQPLLLDLPSLYCLIRSIDRLDH